MRCMCQLQCRHLRVLPGASVGIVVVITALLVVVASVVVLAVVVVPGPNGHMNGAGDKIHLQLDRS